MAKVPNGVEKIVENFNRLSSLADLFNRFDNHTVIDFIKETHFYHQL